MDDKTIPPHLVTPRDWAGVALREATVMAGTPEGAAKLAESKRYAALADALHERDKVIERQAAELAALRASTASVQADQRAENDRLRADAALLDWIECCAMNGQIQIARSMLRTGYEIAVIDRDSGTTVKVHNGTLRQAIGAASTLGNG